MTKLVFHLGDMKTGSTAIQTALSSRAWACESVRLLYPHGNKVSHITFAQSLSGRVDRSRTEKLVNEILDEIAGTPSDVAVISAEHFEHVDPAVLMVTIQKYMPEMLDEARFIAYVRPHADRFPSTYAERVKTGQFLGTLTELQEMLHSRENFVYTPRFLAWRKVFGAAFELRPMIRDLLFRKDVVADFLQFALQTEDFTVADTLDANESLSLENLAVVHQLHLRLSEGQRKFQNYQSTVGRALARRMNDSAYRKGTKVRIHKALAEVVRQQYTKDAAALDAAFFKGTPMMDALNTAPSQAVDEAQSLRIEDHFTEREQNLINTFVDQIAVLIDANPDILAESLRVGHRSKVIAEDDLDATDTPARRRAIRGGKLGGKPGSKVGGARARARKAAKAGAGWANRVKAAFLRTVRNVPDWKLPKIFIRLHKERKARGHSK